MLIPEAAVSRILAMVRNLHQAAPMHKLLHESVDFMTDLRGLQYAICTGGPSLDFSEFEVTLLVLFAR